MADTKKKDKVTKDMSINSILEKHPESAAVFMKHGFHCLGCVAAQFETLEQGAQAHGIDPGKLIKEINENIDGEGKKEKEKK